MLRISKEEFIPMLYDLRGLRFTNFISTLCKFYKSIEDYSDGTYVMPKSVRLSALHCDIVSNKKVIDTEEILFQDFGQANFLSFLPLEDFQRITREVVSKNEVSLPSYGTFIISIGSDIVITKQAEADEDDPLFDIIRCINRFIIKEKDKINSRTFYNIVFIREILVELWRYPGLRVGQIIQPLLKDGEDLFYTESRVLYKRLEERKGKQWTDFSRLL